MKLTQVKYTLLLGGVTKQPELTFNCWFLIFSFFSFWGFGSFAGDSFFSFSFWDLKSGIYHYVDVTGGIFPNPQKKRKEKKEQNNGLFCKWKLCVQMSVGRFFFFVSGKKKSYGSDLEFVFG